MLDVAAGVVVVEWWTTVAVCAGSVTVSVDVVFCATVPVSRLDPLDESVAVVVALDDVSGRAVVGVALLFVVADGLVDAVRV